MSPDQTEVVRRLVELAEAMGNDSLAQAGRALLAAPQAAGEWVRRQDAYGALVESAAELIRLRTEGEPLKAADSERLDSLICGLAVRMRARADTLPAASTQAAQRQTLESMAAQSALEQDPELSDKAQAAQELTELQRIHAIVMHVGGDWPDDERDPYTLRHIKWMARELTKRTQQ